MTTQDDALTPLAELFDPAARADPYPHYRRWRENAPRHRAGGMLVLSRHDDCTAVLRNPAFGHTEDDPPQRQQNPALVDENGRPVRSFLGLNPPDHTRLRRLVSAAFTPRRVAHLAPRVEVLARQHVDEVLGGGPVDLIGSLAAPLPVIVISELLGVPAQDRDLFAGWSHAMARGLDPDFLLPQDVLDQQARARAEFVDYFRELIAERRRHPGDDLLSGLVGVRDQGDALSEQELLATCVLLLIAGHETTVNLIGNGTLALLRKPEQLRRLRSTPDMAERAVEEMLRYDSPVQLTLRYALEDTELAGSPVPAGTFVLALLGAANRDPSAHDDPDRFDIAREPGRHLAFGQGIHFCLGAPLARLEGRIVFQELARRERTLQLAGEPEWKTNIVLRGMSQLPVEPA